MLTEIRHIVFDDAALKEALQLAMSTWGNREEAKWPRGKLERMQVTTKPQISVDMRVYDPEGDERTTAAVGPAEIGAAFVLYCTAQDVALPRDAEKSIGVSDHQLSLIVETALKRKPLKNLA